MARIARIKVAVETDLSVLIGTASATYRPSVAYDSALDVGTSDDEADLVASIDGTVTSASPVTHDLQSLSNASIDASISFDKVKGLIVENKSSTSNEVLLVSAAGSGNEWTGLLESGGTLKVHPGGIAAIWAPGGGMVVSASDKELQVDAENGTDVPYALTIIGVET